MPTQLVVALVIIIYLALFIWLYLKAIAYRNQASDWYKAIVNSPQYCGKCLLEYDTLTTEDDHWPPYLLPSDKNFRERAKAASRERHPSSPRPTVYWISDHEYVPCFLVEMYRMFEGSGSSPEAMVEIRRQVSRTDVR